MSLLPAVVPLTAERRAEVVPARLARNVAPLFGVASSANPFAPLTWTCDFNQITISEIARGAPAITRTRADRELALPPEGWATHGRAVVAARGAALPNEIINATTNRFGPHTKAAVVLTASNVLLEPVASAMRAALALLCGDDGGRLPLGLRIAAWASAAIEVYRSQPALVRAAMKARTIQRESMDSPGFPRVSRPAGQEPARCEIGADAPKSRRDPITHPRDLIFLDHTARDLRLPDRDLPTLAVDDANMATMRDQADELIDQLTTLLVNASEPGGVGCAWITENEPGQAVVEAMLPASGLVEDLLDYWSAVHGGIDEAAEAGFPIRVPAAADVVDLPVTTVRVLCLALLGIMRHLRRQVTGESLPLTGFLARLDELTALATGALEPADATRAVVTARVAVLRVALVRHNTTNPLRAMLDDLCVKTDDCLRLREAGALDRGATADILSAACVELNAVRGTNAEMPGSGLPTSSELDERVRRYWSAFGEALELDPDSPEADVQRGIGHHLHNYASFLASHVESEADLIEADRLFRELVLPARQWLYSHTGVFGPLGRSYSAAARVTTRLAETAAAAGETGTASELAETSYKWISGVLDDREFERLLDQHGDQAGVFALLAAPSLLLALELRGYPLAPDDRTRLGKVLATIDRWMAQATEGETGNYAREAEANRIRERTERLLANG